MIYKTLNECTFMDEFINHNRDYFTYDGYMWLYDLLNGMGDDYEIDVIAICCEFTQSPIGEFFNDHFAYNVDLYDKYVKCDDDGNDIFNMDLIGDFIDYVENFTECVVFDDDTILYRNW